MRPSVVSASKSGAISPSCKVIKTSMLIYDGAYNSWRSE
jgi:hypothetical protein